MLAAENNTEFENIFFYFIALSKQKLNPYDYIIYHDVLC